MIRRDNTTYLGDACGELRQTLITRIEGMIHDVQGELHANNVEHETLDGLCFRGEKLPRKGARLVTAHVLDSSILNCIMFAYEKLTFCSQRVESEETGYRAALLNLVAVKLTTCVRHVCLRSTSHVIRFGGK